jgi:hypothetical protein
MKVQRPVPALVQRRCAQRKPASGARQASRGVCASGRRRRNAHTAHSHQEGPRGFADLKYGTALHRSRGKKAGLAASLHGCRLDVASGRILSCPAQRARFDRADEVGLGGIVRSPVVVKAGGKLALERGVLPRDFLMGA